jgi:glycosyltransferase involved in cell wall biosynthesis
VSADLVSIVLPVYRQADHIDQIVRGYDQALARVRSPYEFILVINGGGDPSLEVCQALAKELSSVRVIHSELGGWGRAVKLGLREARGDLLCYTNSARTAASDLQLMILYAMANPGTVVKAHRRNRESFMRRVGSFLYNLEDRVLFDLAMWDVNATPKVFSRETYLLLQLQEDGDLIDLEMAIRCRQLQKDILEVPVYSCARHGGRSTTKYGSALRMYWGAYRLWRSQQQGKG